MKKGSLILSLLLVSTIIFSCGNIEKGKYPGYEKIEEGLHIKFLEKNEEGRAITVGDVATMDMIYSLDNDSVLFNSKDQNQPIKMQVDSSKFVGDLSGALLKLHEGDSASIIVNAADFFIKTAMMRELPEFVDSSSLVYFEVKVTKVQTMEELQTEEANRNAELEAQESEILEQYLTDNNITIEPTPSGLIFISKEKGSGKAAEAGKTVRVKYEGMLLDGTYFDTSIEEVAKREGLYNEGRTYEPIEFVLGQGKVIPGWDEGLTMMKEGGKAKLIIPSDLAYGANPRPGGPITPFSTLIFEVELVEVVD